MSDKPDDAWEQERNQHVLNALRGITVPIAPAAVTPPVATKTSVEKKSDPVTERMMREAMPSPAPKSEPVSRAGPVLRPEHNLDAIARQRPAPKSPAPKGTAEDQRIPELPPIVSTVVSTQAHERKDPVDATPPPLAGESVGHGIAASASDDRISRMREPRLLSIDDLEAKRIIHPAHTNRRAVERFRDLRTRLLQISKGQNFTLVVSSVVNNGGASFTAINLAATFAFDSSKTALLVDCNLRYPSLHHAFDMIPELGVTDFLDDPVMDVGSIIYPTGIKRMRFVPAGKRREATAEYFTSYRMKQFLESVHNRYPDRFIILDTPSINESPDAGILAELADYTLIVVPHGKVSEGKVLEACARVPREKLLGVVVNN